MLTFMLKKYMHLYLTKLSKFFKNDCFTFNL